MRVKPYLVASAVIFSLVALAHLLRILLGWSVVIAGWHVPVWPSWLALVVLVVLVITAVRLIRSL